MVPKRSLSFTTRLKTNTLSLQGERQGRRDDDHKLKKKKYRMQDRKHNPWEDRQGEPADLHYTCREGISFDEASLIPPVGVRVYI